MIKRLLPRGRNSGRASPCMLLRSAHAAPASVSMGLRPKPLGASRRRVPPPKRRVSWQRCCRAALAAPALLALASCAGYQVVEKSPVGGTISLHGDRDDALDQAKREMEAHCNGPFTIVDEGEVGKEV